MRDGKNRLERQRILGRESFPPIWYDYYTRNTEIPALECDCKTGGLALILCAHCHAFDLFAGVRMIKMSIWANTRNISSAKACPIESTLSKPNRVSLNLSKRTSSLFACQLIPEQWLTSSPQPDSPATAERSLPSAQRMRASLPSPAARGVSPSRLDVVPISRPNPQAQVRATPDMSERKYIWDGFFGRADCRLTLQVLRRRDWLRGELAALERCRARHELC